MPQLFPIVRTLTTPIAMPNINKLEVLDYDDKRDAETDPYIRIVLRFRGVGNRDAGTRAVVAKDAANSTRVYLKPSPSGYGDVILDGTADIPGACTAIGTAYDTALDAATGGRVAKLKAAVEAALAQAETIGLVGPGLVST